jgi:LTXXQ motif family protein
MHQLTRLTVRAAGAAAFLAIATFALPPAAVAQSTVTPSAGAAPPPAASTAKPATRKRPRTAANTIERRIADLHARLKITPDQEDKWNQVAQVMRDNAKAVDTVIRERAQKASSMSAVDDLKSYERVSQVHEEGLQKLIPAFQALYDSMPDAQKKNADQVFRARERRAAKAG